MIKINPYISFDGQCKEAMKLYQTCFGGELHLMTMADGPMANETPKDQLERIMHAELKHETFTLMATDMQGPAGYKPGNDMGIQVIFDDESKMHQSFDQLAKGGEVFEPLRKQFWGDVFGVLRDKYGKKWQFLSPGEKTE